jgi:hypothetical protein
MKRVLGMVGALALIVTSIGCSTCDCPKCRNFRNAACGPQQCGPGMCGPGGGRFGQGGGLCNHGNMNGGPATPTVVYPYYTTRGPRDFLSSNPRGIGP